MDAHERGQLRRHTHVRLRVGSATGDGPGLCAVGPVPDSRPPGLRRRVPSPPHDAPPDCLQGNKIGEFRGDAQFKTWAFTFVMFEVSAELGRRFRRSCASLDTADRQSPQNGGDDQPLEELRAGELRTALLRAIEEVLTEHQRPIYVSVTLDGVPLDALAAQLGTNRNAIYETMFGARGETRAYLTAAGFRPA